LKYPQIETPLVFLSLFNGKEYAAYEGDWVISNQGKKFKIKDYKKFIQEKIKNNSTAKFGYHQGKGLMVGALARLNLQNKFLNPLAKKYFVLSRFDFKNPYYNNLAQAIEILHFSEEALKLLEKLSKKNISGTQPANLKFGSVKTGIGAIEAPRGTLYHELKADKNGFVAYANIITPTVQNLTSIEEAAQKVLESTKSLPQKKREQLLEMLVRAYDPCITCSVH
jgi:sulfhydrogenase subunit alpha